MPSSGSGTGTPVSSNTYCTLTEFKNRRDITSTDATRDAYITEQIEAASRWIDGQCIRRFYPATETRYFTAQSSLECKVTDLLSITTLKTDEDGDRTYETTWSTTDYDLMPYNYSPYQWLEITPNGLYVFPLTRKGVQIVGSWGYAATTPDQINEACLLKAIQLFNASQGVGGKGGGNASTGQAQSPSDKRIEDLIAPFKRYV